MADETSTPNASKDQALELFKKVKQLAAEITTYQRKGKENRYAFFEQISGHIRNLAQEHSGVLAMSILPGTDIPEQWRVLDVAGSESIMAKVIEKYKEIKQENPEFGSVDAGSAESLLGEVQEMTKHEVEQEIAGVKLTDQDMQEIAENRDFILANSDTGKGNDRVGEFLSLVSAKVANAKIFGVWHKLIGSSEPGKFSKQDFPEPFSAKNFLIAEKVRIQTELLNKTETGRAMIEEKLEQLGQTGGSETVLAQILQGKDVYMAAIQAGQGGGDFNIEGSFDAADESQSLEKFMNDAFSTTEVQKELTEIRPKKLKAKRLEPKEEVSTDEMPAAENPENDVPGPGEENSEKPRWPMK